MRQFLDKLAQFLMEPVNKIVTGMLGVYTMVWGLWVINPFVHTFTSAELYSVLLSALPLEWLWGLFAIIAGLLTLLGVREKHPREEFTGAAASAIHWFVISIFYFFGDWVNTGGITALFLAILSVYVYLTCKVNYNKNREGSIWNR